MIRQLRLKAADHVSVGDSTKILPRGRIYVLADESYLSVTHQHVATANVEAGRCEPPLDRIDLILCGGNRREHHSAAIRNGTQRLQA